MFTDWVGRGRQECRRPYSQGRCFQYAWQGVSSESAADVLFRASDCSICHEQGAGVEDFGGFLPSVGAVFDLCERVGRASARDTLFFCCFAVLFSETEWGGAASLYSQRRRF